MSSAEHEIVTPYISKLKVLSFQITLVDLHCVAPVFHKPLTKCMGSMSLALASVAKHIPYHEYFYRKLSDIWIILAVQEAKP